MLSGRPYYNQTIRKCVAVFGTIFNNIYYTKPSKAKERVPIAYGPSQKFISKLTDAGAGTNRLSLKLPRMSFQITSIDFDSTRQLNKMNRLRYSDSPAGRNTLFQGVAYNVGMDLVIIGKDQDTALQVLEQIVPTFKPDYTVAIKDMHRPGSSMDVPIILQSVSVDDDYEGSYEDTRVLTYTLSFVMKVNFYGEVIKSPIIKTAETYFHTSPTPPAPAIMITDATPDAGIKITTGATDTESSFTATTTFGFLSPSFRL